MQNWNSNLKKRSIDITSIKDIYLLVGKTTALDCEMTKKP